MHWFGTQLDLTHRSIEVYLAGCKPPHCPGCHNPETWDFTAGEELEWEALSDCLLERVSLFDHIWLMGGEPLDQDYDELVLLLHRIRNGFPQKCLWIWTKYSEAEVPAEVKALVHRIKHGRYRADLAGSPPDSDLPLGSLNQRVATYSPCPGSTVKI